MWDLIKSLNLTFQDWWNIGCIVYALLFMLAAKLIESGGDE